MRKMGKRRFAHARLCWPNPEKIAQMLGGEIDLELFEDWIATETWNIHLGNDFEAQRLAFALELRLSEYSSGHLSAPELLQQIKGIDDEPVSIPISSGMAEANVNSNMVICAVSVIQPPARNASSDLSMASTVSWGLHEVLA